MTETTEQNRILIVEDEGLIAMDLQERLEKLGYPVAGVAASGEEALEVASGQLPTLILMDIRLKGQMDGIEAAARIRERLDIPVIFVTAHTDEKTLERAKAAGPLSYIVKPFDQTGLRVHIELARHRHEMERKVRASEAWLSTTLRNVGEAVVATDVLGRIVFLSQAAERLTGWTQAEALGRDLLDVFCAVDDRTFEPLPNPALAVLSGGNPALASYQCRLFSKDDAAVYTIQGSASINRNEDGVIGAVLVFRDVSEQRQLEERALQAKKMEAIAVLAGGLAHDFNNLLMVILGYTDVLLHRTPPSGQEQLLEIRKAGDLASTLTRQLLTLSRKEVSRPQVLDMNAVISDLDKLLRLAIGRKCTLVLSLAREECRIEADPAQMRQILINLATNARDVMPAGGQFQVSTAIDSGSVRLIVEDSGIGMTKGTRERIFEPFFTTKSGGLGTGLGLAIVHSIVTQNKGTIEVESRAGCGSAFKMVFPLAGRPPESTADAAVQAPPAEEPRACTVLIVEDEESIRNLLKEQFHLDGFRTHAAASGEDALLAAKLIEGGIDVLVTDVMMPKMTGPELAKKCLEAHPAMKVVFVSGFSKDSLSDEPLLAANAAVFVAKPFTPSHLTARVKELLAGQWRPAEASQV